MTITDSRRYDYTYRKATPEANLTANTTYYLQVVAHDADGEAVESPVRLATTSYNQYVQPINPTDTTRTGMTVDYMPEETAGWAIWGEDDDNIYLISSEPTETKLPLKGAEGYNNGVYYNDLIASEIYGTTEYEGAIARGLKIEDNERR